GGPTKHQAQTIINNVLGLKRVCERWVPRFLTPEQRQHRVATCQELFDRHEAEGEEFLSKIVTGDETYVTYYMPERRPSATYKFPGPQEKAKMNHTQFRVLYAIFYDMQGLLLAHPVPEPQPPMEGKPTALHSAKLTQAALKDLDIETIPQPPDSPDLLPSEYWLFPHLKDLIKGSSFKGRPTHMRLLGGTDCLTTSKAHYRLEHMSSVLTLIYFSVITYCLIYTLYINPVNLMPLEIEAIKI
ncbi:histone-lysine N-methyltransferase SETMAR-like, partial [Penaeus monodon]|uniref:histone-lysine N-methyltransferase SETMAR-like n=1 Tax=Penaeus monodon TaxID=6687 RepID=UPI0018A740DB